MGRKAQETQINVDAWSECLAVAASVKKKADANKLRARALTLFLTVSTAAIPVFIGLSGDDFFFGKVVPSALAAVSAILVALGQFERPHERWALYRRYHRQLERERKLFQFSVAPYDGEERERVLVSRIAQLEMDLHAEWEGLVPKSDEVSTATAGGMHA